jgi:hypothetical protein
MNNFLKVVFVFIVLIEYRYFCFISFQLLNVFDFKFHNIVLCLKDW